MATLERTASDIEPRERARRSTSLWAMTMRRMVKRRSAVAGMVIAQLFDRGQLISIDPSVYFIDHLPVQVQPADFALIVVASIIVATVATMYPARRAADLAPVDAIRHE